MANPKETEPYKRPPVACYDVFNWPEFRALADRLGIPYELRTLGLSIHLGSPDHLVIVTHSYQAIDVHNKDGVLPDPKPKPEDKVEVADTTNLHNTHWRTAQPVIVPPEHQTPPPAAQG